MIKIKNKLYTPTPLMIGISFVMILLAGFMTEGATSLDGLILPAVIGLVFGYIGLSGVHDR